MELIIDIPEEIYQKIKETNMIISGRRNGKRFDYILFNAVIKGTPLPEHHGDLIDRNSLELDSDWSDYYDGFSAYSESQVRLAPTIIDGE
jgi:hypothetical protein